MFRELQQYDTDYKLLCEMCNNAKKQEDFYKSKIKQNTDTNAWQLGKLATLSKQIATNNSNLLINHTNISSIDSTSLTTYTHHDPPVISTFPLPQPGDMVTNLRTHVLTCYEELLSKRQQLYEQCDALISRMNSIYVEKIEYMGHLQNDSSQFSFDSIVQNEPEVDDLSPHDQPQLIKLEHNNPHNNHKIIPQITLNNSFRFSSSPSFDLDYHSFSLYQLQCYYEVLYAKYKQFLSPIVLPSDQRYTQLTMPELKQHYQKRIQALQQQINQSKNKQLGIAERQRCVEQHLEQQIVLYQRKITAVGKSIAAKQKRVGALLAMVEKRHKEQQKTEYDRIENENGNVKQKMEENAEVLMKIQEIAMILGKVRKDSDCDEENYSQG